MKPKPRATRIIGALLTAAMLAACSGGNPSSSLPTTQTPFKWHGKVGKLSFRLKVPTKHRQAEIARLVGRAEIARGRKPNYFPGSATSLIFKLTKINGSNTTPPTPYDFTVTLSSCNTSSLTSCTVTGGTSAQVRCKLTAGAFSCTINTNAPAATDTFLIETTDTTKILSESALVIGVAVNGTPAGSFSLDPVVHSMAWDSDWIDNTAPYIDQSPVSSSSAIHGNSGGGNGPTEPTWTANVGYTCPSAPTTYCSDPLVNYPASSSASGVAINDRLVLEFKDADGNVIAPVTSSSSPNIPIYVNSNGVEVNVAVVCNNADVQWLNNPVASSSGGDAGPPQTYATLSGAAGSATPNPYLANGASSSFTGALTKFVGSGNPNGSGLPQMNSPETDRDGTSAGGTDAKGNLIADSIWGNNGNSLNYDGGGNATSGATSWTCTATPTAASGGPGVVAVKYYIGLAEGAITGARIRPIKIHPHH